MKDIRYNSKAIILIILIISILVGIFSMIRFEPVYSSSEYESLVRKKFRDDISNSTYGENYDYNYNASILKYYIKSEKLKDGNFETETENLKTNYMTNDTAFSRKLGYGGEFDPFELQFKEGYLVIRGTWVDNQNLKVYADETDDLSGREVELFNIFYETLIETYENIYNYDDLIKKIDFAYVLNPNSDIVDSYIKTMTKMNQFYFVEMISILTAVIILCIMAISTDIKKSEDVYILNGIMKFPLEIVIILTTFLWLGFFLGIESIRSINKAGIPIGIIPGVTVFFFSFTIYYIVLGIKSLLVYGKKSFVIENSIIVRFVNWIISKIKLYANNFDGTNAINWIVVYVVLVVFGFLVIYSGFFKILWIVFLTLAFNYFKRYYDDLKEIEEVSESISKGDYNAKIDEENSRFRTIAHNLNSVSKNLDKAVDDAIKSERMKTELITNVSHDLKTPLTSIINYSDLIIDDNATSEEKENYAKIIHEKSLKLKKLIEDLFEVSKVSSRSIELNIEKIDFVQLVEQVLGEWDDKLTEKNLEIKTNLPEGPVILELDGHQTSRTLDNLFSNICKYAMENTRVYIDLSKDGERNKLVLKNISKYPLNISADELMERFTRGDESRNTEGSGLGLSIASSLIEMQGGEFKIEIDGDLFKTIILL